MTGTAALGPSPPTGPAKATWTSWTDLSGERPRGLVVTEVTEGMPAWSSDVASPSAFCWSAGVRARPSLAETAMSPEAPAIDGKSLTATAWACCDGYESGRNDELLLEVKVARVGDNASTATTATAQAPMTR